MLNVNLTGLWESTSRCITSRINRRKLSKCQHQIWISPQLCTILKNSEMFPSVAKVKGGCYHSRSFEIFESCKKLWEKIRYPYVKLSKRFCPQTCFNKLCAEFVNASCDVGQTLRCPGMKVLILLFLGAEVAT